MLIRLTKAKNGGKQDRLTCVRDDGSQTSWLLSSHLAQHDLLHYVVETTLGLEEAFFGLIARGRGIDSFGTRDGQKDVYTKDETNAELIVGLLQAQMRSGDTKQCRVLEDAVSDLRKTKLAYASSVSRRRIGHYKTKNQRP